MSKLLEEYFTYEEEEETPILEEQHLQFMVTESETQISEQTINLLEMAETQKKLKMEHKARYKHPKQTNLKIEYEENINTKREKKLQTETTLEKVDFSLKTKQYSQMNFEAIGFYSVKKVLINEKYHKLFQEYKEEYLAKYQWDILHEIPTLIENQGVSEISYQPLKNLDCLRRYFHGQCIIGNSIVIYGGQDKKKATLNDLVVINASTMEIKHIDGNLRKYDKFKSRKNSVKLSSLLNAQIVPFDETDIFIVGNSTKSGMISFDYVSNVTGDFQFGAANENQGFTQPTDRFEMKIPMRTGFSVAKHNRSVFIFGGILFQRKQVFNEMYCVTFKYSTTKRNGFNFHQISSALSISKIDNEYAPYRYNHATSVINDKMYIFGGSNDKKLCNDLFCYDFQNEKWFEIISSLSPQPLIHSTLTTLSMTSFILYGGISSENETSNIMYKYDVPTNEWNIMKVLSKNDEDLENLQIPLFANGSSVFSNNLFLIGGSDGENVIDNAIVINKVQDPGNDECLSKYLFNARKDEFLCDVSFLVRDVDGNVLELKAHKCIIDCRCSFISQILNENIETKEISIDFCSAEIFQSYLDFLYSGKLQLPTKTLVEQFLDFIKNHVPDLYPIISTICTLNDSMNLKINSEISDALDADLFSLQENKKYSDIKINLDSENSIELHKLLLCRSKYFKNMFQSGMKESVSNEIDLEEIQKDVFIEVLEYLYTDNVKISNANCIGVLVSSLMFELTILSSKCRLVVEKNLMPSTACQLTNIADIYGDLILKRICIKYMKFNYEVVKHLDDFLDLHLDVQKQVKEGYQKLKENEMKKNRKKLK
eukprot:gene10427-2954_t